MGFCKNEVDKHIAYPMIAVKSLDMQYDYQLHTYKREDIEKFKNQFLL